jgi:hypothetical protein
MSHGTAGATAPLRCAFGPPTRGAANSSRSCGQRTDNTATILRRKGPLPPRLQLYFVPSRYCSAPPVLHLDLTKFFAAIGARRNDVVRWREARHVFATLV